MKICLAGDAAVGKTSLVRRFVSNTFEEHYTMTLGAKVSSRRYPIEDPRKPGSAIEVGATIWDIMGHIGFREIMKDTFFHGAHAVLLVCDGTRPETMWNLAEWWKSVLAISGRIPAILLVNKSDLMTERRLPPADVENFCTTNGWSYFTTSAKTGDNVETAFARIAQMHLKNLPPGVKTP